MPKLKLMMIVNTQSDAVCEYYPPNCPMELVNEMKDVASCNKNIIFKGKVETKINKFTYQQYMDKDFYSSSFVDEDRLVVFLCSDKSYKDNDLDNIIEEMFKFVNPQSYNQNKISTDTRNNLAKTFNKYKDFQNIREDDFNTENLEFTAIKDFSSVGMGKDATSFSFNGMGDTLDEKDKKSRGSEFRSPSEINNIRKWRKLKIVYLIITIILLIAVGISFYFVKDKIE